jgi:hypothetical protein
LVDLSIFFFCGHVILVQVFNKFLHSLKCIFSLKLLPQWFVFKYDQNFLFLHMLKNGVVGHDIITFLLKNFFSFWSLTKDKNLFPETTESQSSPLHTWGQVTHSRLPAPNFCKVRGRYHGTKHRLVSLKCSSGVPL